MKKKTQAPNDGKETFISLYDVQQAIGNEPEFEGDMPDDVWADFCSDKHKAEAAFRLIVRLTKEGIMKRLNQKTYVVLSEAE